MTALLLVATGSLLHAVWNLLAKRAGTAGIAFVWLYSVVVLPLGVVLLGWFVLAGDGLGQAWWAALVSMCLHTTYAVALQKAYSRGDFSIIYPASRGLAPVLVLAVATPWQGAPAWWAWVGMGVVLAGLGLMMTKPPGSRHATATGVGLGGLVALCICGYTLWDAFAVTTLNVSVLPYLAVTGVVQALVLSLVVLLRRTDLRATVVGHWRSALPIALLVPLSYGLVLLAMQSASVGIVAASRTLNVVFAVLLGIVVLDEEVNRRRLGAVALITAGVLLTAWPGG